MCTDGTGICENTGPEKARTNKIVQISGVEAGFEKKMKGRIQIISSDHSVRTYKESSTSKIITAGPSEYC